MSMRIVFVGVLRFLVLLVPDCERLNVAANRNISYSAESLARNTLNVYRGLSTGGGVSIHTPVFMHACVRARTLSLPMFLQTRMSSGRTLADSFLLKKLLATLVSLPLSLLSNAQSACLPLVTVWRGPALQVLLCLAGGPALLERNRADHALQGAGHGMLYGIGWHRSERSFNACLCAQIENIPDSLKEDLPSSIKSLPKVRAGSVPMHLV